MRSATTILVTCVALLLALGMVMLYSASMTKSGAHFLVMQLIWAGLGALVCLVAASIDYKHLRKVSLVLLFFAMVLLVLALIPGVGLKANGARRWLNFGGFSFQPSELGKVALIIFLAHYGERYQRQMGTFYRGLLIPGAAVALVLGLIVVEVDVGCTLLLGAVSVALLLVAGVKWRYVLPPLLIGLIAVSTFIYSNPTRSKRIYAWLHPEETRLGIGLQGYQSMIALGSGGLTGRGLGESRQKHGFVPEDHTDFILAIIGEELGLIATLGILLGFVIIVCCGIYIAWRARETFGLLLGSGLTFLIGLQAFINVGVVTNVLPNKGMPLPFISYGGSNLLFMLCSVGLLLNIARHAPEISVHRRNPFGEEPAPQSS